MGYGFWQGAERATGNMAATGMQLLQFQANKQIQQDKLDLLKRTEARHADLQGVQIRKEKALADEAERNAELIPISETLAALGVKRPAEQKFLMDYAGPYIQSGPASGLPSIQRNHAQEIYGKLLKDVDANIKLDTIRAQEAQREIDAIDAQMTNPETSGKLKPEQVAQLQKQRAGLVTERTISDNSVRRLTREKGKESLKNFWNPDTKQWVQKNIVTDDLTGLIPEEVQKEAIKAGAASQTEEQLTTRALKGDKGAQAILDAMQKRKLDIAAARESGTHERADRQFAVTLRKEFNALPEVKEYNETMPKIKSMQSAFEASKKTKNFVAIDQALITLYNKLTDPTSVVRESEYARTAQNIPLINQIRGKAEKVLRGGAGLTGEERKALMDMAMLMQRGYEEIRTKRLNEYRGYGAQGGLESDFLQDATGNMPQKVGRFIVEAE